MGLLFRFLNFYNLCICESLWKPGQQADTPRLQLQLLGDDHLHDCVVRQHDRDAGAGGALPIIVISMNMQHCQYISGRVSEAVAASGGY